MNNKVYNWKKLISTVLVLIMTVVLAVGCSNSKTVNSDESTSDNDGNDYITLGDYIGIEVEQTIVEITDEYVQEYIDEEMTEYNIVDRAIEAGDYVVINYTTYVAGEEDEDLSDEGIGITIGDYEIFDEFDDNLIGKSAEDKVEISVDASVYDDSYEGLDTVSTVEIVEVYEIVINEITDEYVQETYDYDTADEYKEALKAQLYEEEYEYAVEEMEYNAWLIAVENATLNDYTDEMYDEYYELFMSDMESYAEMFGYDDTETFMEEWGYTDDVIVESVEEYIKEDLVCKAIAEAEGLELTDEEYEEGLEELATEYEYDSTEEFAEDYDTDDIKDYLLLEKVMSFIGDNAVVVEVEAEDDEDYDN